MAKETLYELDFYSWTLQQAGLLRAGRLDEIDVENIFEEVESLGKSHRTALRSAYRLIALHLLKLAYQPDKASRSWRVTIIRERDNIIDILHESPGLKPQRKDIFATAYTGARKEAAADAGLSPSLFPKLPPFTVEDAEDETYFCAVPPLVD